MTGRLAIGLALLVTPAHALEIDPPMRRGEYPLYFAEVTRVIDGDTLSVEVSLWPGLTIETDIRLRGIDAPEVSRTGCEEEAVWGEEASAWLANAYPAGTQVRIEEIGEGTFAGRTIARVSRWDGTGWLGAGDELMARDLAVPWTPDMDAVPWCLLAQTREAPAE